MNCTASKGGVYALRNVTNGKSYYGESKNVEALKRSQHNRLEKGTYSVSDLQYDYNKGDAFDFQVIAYSDDLETRNMILEDFLKTDDNAYNEPDNPLEAFGIPKFDTRKYEEIPFCILQSVLKKVDKCEGISTSDRINRILEKYFRTNKS